jgi:hypothetical protein
MQEARGKGQSQSLWTARGPGAACVTDAVTRAALIPTPGAAPLLQARECGGRCQTLPVEVVPSHPTPSPSLLRSDAPRATRQV